MADITEQEKLQIQQQLLEVSRDLAETEKAAAAAAKEYGLAAERAVTQSEEELKIAKVRYELLLSSADTEEQKAAATQAYAEIQKQITENLREQQKTQEAIQGIEKETDGLVGSIASKLGLSADNSKGLFRQLMNSKKSGEGLSVALSRARKSLGRIVTAGNVAVSIFEKFAESTLIAAVQVDATRASFVAMTGDMSGARDMFIGLTFDNLDLALSFQQVAGAQMSLREEFAQFGFLSDSVRKSVTMQAAQLQKLGIDAGTTAETMNTLTLAFGQSATDAAATQREIIGLGQALKIPPAVIARDFAQALPHLSQFGDNAVDVFKELSIEARRTGTSVADLTSIFGDQFNTFEGSAQIAGKLNQILRTDLFSTNELLMASDSERLEIVRERIRLSGVDFDNMGRYAKLNIANALGIRDVATASKLLGESQDEVAMRLGDTSFTTSEMEEITQNATSTMEKLQFIMLQTAVAVKPLVDAFAAVVQGILDLSESVPGGFGTILALAGAVAGGMAAGPLGALPGLGLAIATATGFGTTAVGDNISTGTVAINEGFSTPTKVTHSGDTTYSMREGGPLLETIKKEIRGGGSNSLVVEKMVVKIPGLRGSFEGLVEELVLGRGN
jgi:hypothetical protein